MTDATVLSVGAVATRQIAFGYGCSNRMTSSAAFRRDATDAFKWWHTRMRSMSTSSLRLSTWLQMDASGRVFQSLAARCEDLREADKAECVKVIARPLE